MRPLWVVVALVAVGCSRPSPPDVLLVTLDTVRADALGSYSGSQGQTTNLDALAAAGTRFAEASTTVPLTLPAHASILTGLWPEHHGVHDNLARPVAEEVRTLAQVLLEQGYSTRACVASVVLDRSFGLDRGFQVYDDAIEASATALPERDADAVLACAAQALADSNPRGPTFLWVHFYDAHAPWHDTYAGEVRRVDAAVGRLIHTFDAVAEGRPRFTVVVADHGEGLGDHGEQHHGMFVYRSTARVPLIVHGPGIPPGRVVDDPVSVVDIAPTVAALVGVSFEADGRSLVPAFSGTLPPRPVRVETVYPRAHFGLADLRAVQDGAWRYIDAPEPELYAWTSDPAELANRAQDRQDIAGKLAPALGPRPVSEAAGLVPSTRDALAALGYVAEVAEPGEILDDPKHHPDLDRRWAELVGTARTATPADAVAAIDGFLQSYPRVSAARHLRVAALERAGRLDEARAELGVLRALTPDDPFLIARDADLRTAAGDPKGARDALEAWSNVHPPHAAVRTALAELYRRDGDCGRALPLVHEALREDPRFRRAQLIGAACEAFYGDPRRAQRTIDGLRASDPHNADLAFLDAMCALRQARFDDALPGLAAEVERKPAEVLPRAALATALYETGRYTEALGHFEVVGPVSRDPAVVTRWAEARRHVGRPVAEVEAALERAWHLAGAPAP